MIISCFTVSGIVNRKKSVSPISSGIKIFIISQPITSIARFKLESNDCQLNACVQRDSLMLCKHRTTWEFIWPVYLQANAKSGHFQISKRERSAASAF